MKLKISIVLFFILVLFSSISFSQNDVLWDPVTVKDIQLFDNPVQNHVMVSGDGITAYKYYNFKNGNYETIGGLPSDEMFPDLLPQDFATQFVYNFLIISGKEPVLSYVDALSFHLWLNE